MRIHIFLFAAVLLVSQSGCTVLLTSHGLAKDARRSRQWQSAQKHYQQPAFGTFVTIVTTKRDTLAGRWYGLRSDSTGQARYLLLAPSLRTSIARHQIPEEQIAQLRWNSGDAAYEGLTIGLLLDGLGGIMLFLLSLSSSPAF